MSKITKEDILVSIKALQHIKLMKQEWVIGNGIINLDVNEIQITDSWKYEYNIFELVRIYKSFNWKKDLLIFHAW